MRACREDLGTLAYTVEGELVVGCVLAYIIGRLARVRCEA
jgi:hypothetical protein